MAEKKSPRRKSHRLHNHAWWYEDRGGIVVVQEAPGVQHGAHIATLQVAIPWARLLSAAQRCYSKEVIVRG